MVVGVEPLVTLLTLLYIVDIIYMWNINMEYHTVHLLLPKFPIDLQLRLIFDLFRVDQAEARICLMMGKLVLLVAQLMSFRKYY